MALKIDYYTTLSRAVAGLDRDSYAARGAVYDREHKALMRRLFSADPPLADGEVQREQRAFRDAIRRVEFGEDEIEIPLVPQRDPPEYGSPAAAGARRAQSNLSRARTLPSPQKSSGEVWPLRRPVQGPPVAQGIASVDPALELMPDPAAPVPPTTAAQVEGTAAAAALLKRKPIGGRVFGRALIGIALLGLSAVAYDLLTGEIGLPLLQKLAGTRAPPLSALPVESAPTGVQQVILFDGNRPVPNATKFAGTATWRSRSERASLQAETVAVLDLNVPGRKITLTMTIRREPPGSAMSHLIEFRFAGDDKEPDPDITNIGSVLMTTAEMTRPTLLVGQVVSVTPGVFLFGLSGEASAREKNLRSLQELGWMGIPLAYRNGASGLLVVEKGVDGERAINEALRQRSD